MTNIKDLFKEYTKKELLLAFLTKWLFTIPLLTILLIPVINLLLLYVPFMAYFFIAILLGSSSIMFYTNTVFINTLKEYKTVEHINYKILRVSYTVLEFILISITLIIVYNILN